MALSMNQVRGLGQAAEIVAARSRAVVAAESRVAAAGAKLEACEAEQRVEWDKAQREKLPSATLLRSRCMMKAVSPSAAGARWWCTLPISISV